MSGKSQTEIIPGLGDRIAVLLRRHATINNGVALAKAANLSRQTLHRALNHNEATLPTGRAIASALGVTVEELYVGAPDYRQLDILGGFMPPEPHRHARNLPLAIREYLAELRVRLTKGGASEDEIDEAFDLLRSPAVFTFYKGGTPSEFNEEDVLRGMKALAEGVVIPELRDRGRKIR